MKVTALITKIVLAESNVFWSIMENDLSENTSLTQDASFRYANALFNLALETNSAHKFEKDLDKIFKILDEDPNFYLFIKSPLYPRENQLSTMKLSQKLKLNSNVINNSSHDFKTQIICLERNDPPV